jgi:hypothetical protein
MGKRPPERRFFAFPGNPALNRIRKNATMEGENEWV